jgi:hypothetical protein
MALTHMALTHMATALMATRGHLDLEIIRCYCLQPVDKLNDFKVTTICLGLGRYIIPRRYIPRR